MGLVVAIVVIGALVAVGVVVARKAKVAPPVIQPTETANTGNTGSNSNIKPN